MSSFFHLPTNLRNLAKRPFFPNQLGVTLIELLLVMAIILSLGATTAVFYSRMVGSNNVANAADQMVSELRKAQVYAMAGRQNDSWGVKYASNKITLFQTSNTAFNEDYTLTNVTISGFTTVTFAKGTGIPSGASTITFTGSGITKTVTIDAQGVISR